MNMVITFFFLKNPTLALVIGAIWYDLDTKHKSKGGEKKVPSNLATIPFIQVRSWHCQLPIGQGISVVYVSAVDKHLFTSFLYKHVHPSNP